MKLLEQYKGSVIAAIVAGSPEGFWAECRQSFRRAYADVFHSVANDPNLVEEQRILKLAQDRHFRMEMELLRLAQRHGMAASPTLLAQNSYQYVYVVGGDVGFTQSYVPDIESMPHRAKYWQSMAEATGIPRLDLGDEPQGIVGVRSVYGLLTHNPVGRMFSEDHQKLGMIQFSIPYKDSKDWAVQFTIEEILAMYPESKKAQPVSRAPQFKAQQQKKNQGKD